MIIRKPKTKGKQYSNSQITILPFLILGVIIFILFLLLQPKIATSTFSYERNNRLATFINTVKNEQTIDPQTYWKFREFYSAGHFEFSRSGFTTEKTESYISTNSLPFPLSDKDQPFLLYSSPHFKSIDILTPVNELPAFNMDNARQIIWRNHNHILYREEDGSIIMIFIKPFKALEEANGFFDYTDKDKALDRNLYWLNRTIITP